MRARSTHHVSLPCGLPSPGSRLQSGGPAGYYHPATEESVYTTDDLSRVTCKRCRRVMSCLRLTPRKPAVLAALTPSAERPPSSAQGLAEWLMGTK